MNQLMKSFALMLDRVLDARNRMPGFAYIPPKSLCCELDYIRSSTSVEYEPGYVQICKSKLCINSPIIGKRGFEICEKTSNKLRNHFKQFEMLQNKGFSLMQLYTENKSFLCTKKAEDTDYDETNSWFILNKNGTRILCAVIYEWVYPVVTMFVSLNNRPTQKMLIGWNLSAMKCREEDKTYVIENDISEPVNVNLLCKKDVKFTLFDLDMFHLEFSKGSVQNMKQYRDFVLRRSKKKEEERKNRQLYREVGEAAYYLGCLTICAFFLYFVISTVRKYNAGVGEHQIR